MAGFRPHCCRFESVLNIHPTPVFRHPERRLVFFSNEGKAMLSENTPMDSSCQIHRNTTATDLLFTVGAVPKPLSKLKVPDDAQVLDWKAGAARSHNVFMRTALQWRTQLHAELTPGQDTFIYVLFRRSGDWPAGVYLCDEKNVLSSRLVWNCWERDTEATGRHVYALPVFPSGGTYHCLYGVRSVQPSFLYMSDHLYFSLLNSGVSLTDMHSADYQHLPKDRQSAGTLCYSDGKVQYYWLLFKNTPLTALPLPTVFLASWGVDNKELQGHILHSLFGITGVDNLYRFAWQDPVTKILQLRECPSKS